MPEPSDVQGPSRFDPVARVNAVLDEYLPDEGPGLGGLHGAMRYAVLGDGKRMRPQLVYATGAVIGADDMCLDAPACAVELIHAYSLIHDDLPAMDDDDMRRGRPSTHKAYDEATAILAGDALQALAFEALAQNPALTHDAEARLRCVHTLSQATGSSGMVGGQALDMAAENRPVTLEELEAIHRMKTGALLRACVLLACDCTPALEPERRNALDRFADRIGLAFQVRDDILDVEGDTETLGKRQRSDTAQHKATYPALLGMDEAKARAERLYEQAMEALAPFGDKAEPLKRIARFIVQRDR